MIITLKGANFSQSNIGTLDSWFIAWSGSGLTAAAGNATSIKKDGTSTTTLTYTYNTENYKYISGTVKDATGATVGSVSASNGTVTVTINAGNTIKGKITIAIIMEYIGAGEEPETPVNPTNYTFTINPNPNDATVTMALDMNSITTGTSKSNLDSGDSVWYLVEAPGYATESDVKSVSSNLTENISLTPYGASGTKLPITWYPQEYYYSVAPTAKYNNILTMDRITKTNSPSVTNHVSYWATQIFTKDTLPNGSIITIAEGYQYRPDGVVNLSTQRTTSNRPANVTTASVTVDDSWWNGNEYIGFNISAVNSSSLVSKTEDDLNNIFSITLP